MLPVLAQQARAARSRGRKHLLPPPWKGAVGVAVLDPSMPRTGIKAAAARNGAAASAGGPGSAMPIRSPAPSLLACKAAVADTVMIMEPVAAGFRRTGGWWRVVLLWPGQAM